MSPKVSPDLLGEAVEWLRALDHLPPERARERLSDLRDRYPEVSMRLLWQREAAVDEYHYDLLFPSSEGTVSLAFAPNRVIPWPLRGGQRSGEQLVLRVNGVDMTMEKSVSVLDVLWEDTGLARRLVDTALVEQALATRQPELSADRLQEAMDAFRRARGLLTAQATREWMAERGVSHARLEEIVASEAAVAALRRDVVGNRVEDYFAAHRDGFDRLRVVRLRYADPERADVAAARLRNRDADAVALAADEALAGVATCRIEANLREELSALFGPPAAGSKAGHVLGPARLADGGLCVAHVMAVEPAVLDEVNRRFIEKRVFDEWLAEQRRHAHIEWFWGSRPRTDELTAALRT
ncbi:TIGR04500 family putative peptide maturation system protein [Microbispora sp. NEAU-D428]|uniref:TIGR04500 family putative peptide maturation system protein n=1 Tax=Microbispora sitophila TaxID=2771537 RepID=UPI0018660C36|nr:TIGR04500 family putative peptide maturation system protein [Microbispora sitophila]MBE3013584.1 TIGR04500 family putative peptide maturation system protein [Microbispora sitophila]